ncbi:vesicle transport protein SFT2C [Ornithorhynchus anatinus]|uniref:vesicle transport protein SFT2C n=1 Tax=Ornithorhynchus anatinus TaxID=9258 RepID=UPI0010A80E78|nr:vesicle transport protein SFT2C [Ornithorhynchus anatinus]
MADLHRQLQDYLARSKGAGPAAEAAEGAEGAQGAQGARGWLARLSPFGRRAEAASSGGGGRCPGGWRRWAWGGLGVGLWAACVALAGPWARRLALLWSLGSGLAAAAAWLWVWRRARRAEELPWRAAGLYLAALAATLYGALLRRGALLAALGAAAQTAVLVAALLGRLPWGGAAALRYALGATLGRGLPQGLPV